MQDNAPPHRAVKTKEGLEEQSFSTIDWPALSPDLNPIENVWGLLVQKVYVGGKQYFSVPALKAAIQKAWDELTQEELAPFLNSMRKRLCQVIERQGKHINY